jgi:hypothetical protein
MVCKIIQRALFLGICNGPLAIPWTYVRLPGDQKRVRPSDHGSEYDYTPLIVKSGQNYAYTRFTGGRRPLWATGTYVQGVDPQKGLANQC